MKRRVEPNPNSAIIAHIVGPGATAEQVETVINYSNEHLIMVHGIKRASSIADVTNQGIWPLAPEGGPGSFWTIGARIFCSDPPTTGSASWTFDIIGKATNRQNFARYAKSSREFGGT